METNRLIIDRIKESDKADYFANISNDKKVLETFICRYAETLEEFDFSTYLGRDDLFAIRLKDTGRLIGIILYFDEKDGACEIGYGIGSNYWNNGYVTEAVKCFIQFLFSKKKLKKVYASFFTGNEASKRVMEKCGMHNDHFSPKELEYLGVERDLTYYVICNPEYVFKKLETDEEIKGKAYVAWRTWKDAYVGIVNQEYLDNLKIEKVEEIAYKFKDDVIIAKDGEKVVGFVAYGKCRDKDLETAGEIYAIYVLEDYHGKGIGKRLVAEALEQLNGYHTVALWVFKDNARARRFYEKCGFKPDGKVNTFEITTPLDEVRMIKAQDDLVYIVAGDEMKKLFAEKYPDVKTIPFRENFSVGNYDGFDFDDVFVKNRAIAFGATVQDYKSKLSPIINLDFEREYVLCFGECDCCKANLKFLTNYLLVNGYANPIKIRIVDETTLETIREYVYQN